MLNSKFLKRFALSITAMFLFPLTFNVHAQHEREGPMAPPEADAFDTLYQTPDSKVDTLEGLEERIASDPKDPINYNNLATHYVRSGRYDQALEPMEKAVKFGPGMAPLHVNLSLLYDVLGRTEDSLRSAELAVKIVPAETRARMNLCTLYNYSSRFRDAVSCFEVLATMMQDDPFVNLGFAFAALGSGAAEKTITILEKVVTENPAFAAAHNLLGAAQYKKKKYSAARVSFKSAVELEPHVTYYRFNLGMAEMTGRNKSAALSQYNFIKEKDPQLAAKMYRYIYADKLVFVGSPDPINPRWP